MRSSNGSSRTSDHKRSAGARERTIQRRADRAAKYDATRHPRAFTIQDAR